MILLQVVKGVIKNMTPDIGPQLIILRPHGPQGGGVGLQVNDIEDYKKLDEEMGKLDPKVRKTFEGIKEAAEKAGVDIVDD